MEICFAGIGLGLNVQDNAEAHLDLGLLNSGQKDYSFQSLLILWWAWPDQRRKKERKPCKYCRISIG